MFQVFVSTFPFGKSDPTPRLMLEAEKSIKVTYNPYPRKLTRDEIAELAKDADAIIAGTEDLSLLIENSSKLKLIARVGIGLDSVNLAACKAKGIRVCYTPDAVTQAVAELTVGLMITVSRQIGLADKEIREGKWVRHYGKRIGESLVGLIGFGRVGKSVVRLLQPFGAKILVNDITEITSEIDYFQKRGVTIHSASKDEIFKNADIVSLHLPAYSLTKNLISKQTLSQFRKDAILINTARGELVDEQDLFLALKQGQIAGAALDVFHEEPYLGSFCKLSNVILSQHMGSCSYDCCLAMESEATEDTLRFLKGQTLLREVPEVEYSYQ
jgi:D-3-phosphoglycerate dehydrogenase